MKNASVETKISRVLAGVKLVAKHFPVTKRTKRVSYCLTTLSGRVVYGVHSSTMKNVLRGLRERVFAVERDGSLQRPPQALPGVFQRLAWFSARVSAGIQHQPIEAMAFAELYTGRRRTVYTKAAESLDLLSICKDDAALKTFVKCEKINFTAKPDPAPRVIQPRTPRYNVALGRYLKTLEHRLLHRITKVARKEGGAIGQVVAKGINAQQLGHVVHAKWERFRRPVAVGVDASRFDQHCGVDALKWEHGVYKSAVALVDRDELTTLLSWQLKNKGRAFADDGMVKYEVDGCRMSGDINTGLGNCLIMCGLICTYFRESGITDYDLVNNGDDCVMLVEEEDLEKVLAFDRWALPFGYTMVMEKPVRVLEEVEFCQMHPVLGPDGYTMVRNHATVFSKDTTTTHDLSDRATYNAFCYAIGGCGAALTRGIPCQQSFYAKLSSVGKPTKMEVGGGLGWWSKGMAVRGFAAPTPESRYSYWLAFGVLPDVQVELESYFGGVDLAWVAPIDMDLCQGHITHTLLI